MSVTVEHSTVKAPRAKRPTRQEHIRKAAMRLFADVGYDRTSLKDIADEIGVTHPALYYYYKSKDAILFDAIASNMRELLRRLGTPTEERSPFDELHAIAKKQVLFQLEFRGMTSLADSVLFGPLRRAEILSAVQYEELDTLQRDLVSRYRGVIDKGIASGAFVVASPAMATFTLLGAISYVVYWYRDEGPVSEDAMADMIVDFCLSALLPR